MRYELDERDRIVKVDDDWESFAKQNGARNLGRDSVIGSSIWDHVAGAETRELYVRLLRRVRGGAVVAAIPFRCDSPGVRRELRLSLHRLPRGHVRITTKTHRIELRPPLWLLDPAAPRGRRTVDMCGWCKRVREAGGPWTELEDAAVVLEISSGLQPRLTHVACADCRELVTY